jgi:cytoskeletal protein CcmA (bactofilin family)
MSSNTDPLANSVFIGKGTTFTGTISSEGLVVINGNYTGSVHASKIQVGEMGFFNGKAVADDLDIQGKAGNNLIANKYLRIRSTAAVTGKISYKVVDLDRGAKINGSMDQIL